MSNQQNNLYGFDEYSLNERERNFRKNGEIVPLTPKVFETLRVLLEADGNTVTKKEMLDRVWEDAFVEESNLTQNIYLLRQMFGKERTYIATVPRSGYRFAAPLAVTDLSAEAHPVELQGSDKASAGERSWMFAAGVGATVLLTISIAVIGALTLFGGVNEETPIRSEPVFKRLVDISSGRSPTISPDGRFVAYLLKQGQEQQVRLRDVAADSDLEISINGGPTPSRLEFSPDGKFLFFRERGRSRAGQRLYRVPYLGGDAKPVAENAWGGFAVSPDGDRLAFFRSDTAANSDSLIIKDIATGEETVKLTVTVPDVIFMMVAPAWSPDGKSIAFLSRPRSGLRSSIDILDLGTGKIRSLQTDLSKIFDLSWLPGGGSLLALSKEPEKGRQVFQVDLASGKASRVTNDLNMYAGLSVSADGKTIVTEIRHLTSNLWVYAPNAADAPKQLTEGSYGHVGLTDLHFATENRVFFDARSEVERDLWAVEIEPVRRYRMTENNGTRNTETTSSQDGEHVYFVSDRSGLDNIWRQDQKEAGVATQVTFSETEAHRLPSLSADQKHLYFAVRSAENNTIKRLSIADGIIETVYASKTIAPQNFLEASQDGRYLAFEIEGKEQENGGDGEESATALPVRIGILDLMSPGEPKTFEIRSSRPLIRFTSGGASFDYLRDNAIYRQKIDEPTAEAVKVFQLNDENIFNFDWSLAGTRLAVARGRLNRDIVLITLP